MRRLVLGALLLTAACSGPMPGASSTPTPASSAQAGSGQLTNDACRALTTSDAQTALGVPVAQLPTTSLPPGAAPGGTGQMLSGCSYTASNGVNAGVTLYLFRDMPIDYFGNLPGYQKLNGVGDRAYMQGPMVLGQKGHITFQLIVLTSDQSTVAPTLQTLATKVAKRL